MFLETAFFLNGGCEESPQKRWTGVETSGWILAKQLSKPEVSVAIISWVTSDLAESPILTERNILCIDANEYNIISFHRKNISFSKIYRRNSADLFICIVIKRYKVLFELKKLAYVTIYPRCINCCHRLMMWHWNTHTRRGGGGGVTRMPETFVPACRITLKVF